MGRRIGFALAALAAMCAPACGDGGNETAEPADFALEATATPASGLAPLEVRFDVDVRGTLGIGDVELRWEMGDGTTAEGASATHVYETAGTYEVVVSAVDGAGNTETDSVIVAVGSDGVPAAMASVDVGTGRAPLAVELSCTASGGNEPLRFHWDFGDGSSTDGAEAAHTYSERGTYVATCTVVDADGSSGSSRVTITVGRNDIPEAVASASFSGSDAPLDVDFTGTAIGGDGELSYEWSFGDGGSSTEPSPMHTYEAAGTYRAVLRVTDEDGDHGTDTLTIEVTTPPEPNEPPTASAEITSGSCAVPDEDLEDAGTTVVLDASGSSDPEGAVLEYEWVFVRMPAGSTASLNNPTVLNPSFVPDAEGSYELRVFVSDGSHRVASDVVTVEASGPSEIVKVSGDGQSVEAGSAVEEPLVVRVRNACGLEVSGVSVAHEAANAELRGDFPATDDAGESFAAPQAGELAGSASLDAIVQQLDGTEMSVTFTLDVVPGPMDRVVAGPIAPVVVSDASGATITLTTTDRFGNEVSTAADVTLRIVGGFPEGGSASFDSAATQDTTTVSIGGGSATATVYGLETGRVALQLDSSDPEVVLAGELELANHDFEAVDYRWRPGKTEEGLETWAQGEPAVGPASCASGTGCWGSDLDGDYAPARSYLESSWVSFDADGRRYRSNRWLEAAGGVEYLEVLQQEWYEVPNDAGRLCSDTDQGGFGIGPEAGPFGPRLEPLRGWETTACSPASTGSSGGWVEARYRGAVPGDRLHWTLVRGENPDTGAGWYIDDVQILAGVSAPVPLLLVGACGNGTDDDGDGLLDYPSDPGCVSRADDDETDPATAPACANGVDDDDDGRIDYPADRDCTSAADVSEQPACENGLDDDGDGWVDFEDPGCDFDPSYESNPPVAACSDGVDNDGDGAIDGNDPDCTDAFDPDEAAAEACSDGVDNDGDGWVDLEDPGCEDGDPTSEANPPLEVCSDGVDNDGDGAIDGNDPDCTDPFDVDEGGGSTGTCSDGLDNDGDGWVDVQDFECDPAGLGLPDETGEVSPVACSDGVDNDGDGAIDGNDPECQLCGSWDCPSESAP